VTLEKGIDKNTMLQDAVAFLSDRYDLAIRVDPKLQHARVGLPQMRAVRLDKVLDNLLSPVQAKYILHADHIEITRAEPADVAAAVIRVTTRSFQGTLRSGSPEQPGHVEHHGRYAIVFRAPSFHAVQGRARRYGRARRHRRPS